MLTKFNVTRLELHQPIDVAVPIEAIAEHRSKLGESRDVVPLAECLEGVAVDR